MTALTQVMMTIVVLYLGLIFSGLIVVYLSHMRRTRVQRVSYMQSQIISRQTPSSWRYSLRRFRRFVRIESTSGSWNCLDQYLGTPSQRSTPLVLVVSRKVVTITISNWTISMEI